MSIFLVYNNFCRVLRYNFSVNMKLVTGEELTSKQMSLIEPGESSTFAPWLNYAAVKNGGSWNIPLLLLTTRRLISKEKLLGKPKANFTIAWPEISTVGSESIMPNAIELLVTTTRGIISVFVSPEYATEVEGAIRAGYLSNPNHPAHRRP